MNKLITTTSTFLSILLLVSCQTSPKTEEVLKIIETVNDYYQKNHPPEVNAFWDNAAYHIGNMEAYFLTKNPAYLDYSLRWAEYNEWKGAKSDDKETWKYTYGETDEYVLFGDHQACFQVYIDLYRIDPKPYKIERAIEVMEYQLSTDKRDYWWWADGLFMVMPVMTKLHAVTGNPLYLEKLHEYWSYADSLMMTKRKGCITVMPNMCIRSIKRLTEKKIFGRGNGWVFAAYAKVLQDLPKSDPHRDMYIERFRSMAAALAVCQQPQGYWTRSLLDPEHAPGPETSGTAFFTYGFLWGMNNGYLDKEKYESTIIKSWDYLQNMALQPDGRVGYVQPIGEKAIPGQVVDANSTANFGVGAFLLASCEMVRYLQIKNK